MKQAPWLELVEDGRDNGNVDYDMSDDEDMFCATPVEISNHRNLDI